MNPGGPYLRLTHTDDTARYECLTCGTVFMLPIGTPAICPKCAGIAGIPARIIARIRRIIARINELDSMYDRDYRRWRRRNGEFTKA